MSAPAPKVVPAPLDDADLAIVRQVVLAVEPLDAQVLHGDNDLGKIPVFVEVKEGEKVTVSISREGYASQEVELDGSEGRLSIKLEKETKAAPARVRRVPKRPAAKPKPQPKAAPKKKPSIGGGEIINPWG
jgi:hypothetical protein